MARVEHEFYFSHTGAKYKVRTHTHTHIFFELMLLKIHISLQSFADKWTRYAFVCVAIIALSSISTIAKEGRIPESLRIRHVVYRDD